MGPQSIQNLCSTLTIVAFLQSNLYLGVRGFDESSRSSWLWDSWMSFWEIWVSLVSCNSDEHKLIWAYLGFVSGNALLMGDVDIYLCLIFYLLLEFWEWYDVACFRLGRPPVRPKFLTRNTLLASCHFTFLRSSVMCWEVWSDQFIWSWIHQFFMVNLWCPYFQMYPVWIIYQ